MSEKAALVNKIPPVKKSVTPKKLEQGIESKANHKQASNAKTAKEADAKIAASTAVPQPEIEPPGITRVEQATYYTFIGNMLVVGALGLVFGARAFKNTKAVNFKAIAGYSVFLFILAGLYFFFKDSYAGFLNEEREMLPLAVRGFAWVLLAPMLFSVISFLDSVRTSGRKALIVPIVLSAFVFLFIGLAQQDFSQGIRLAFSGLAIVCSASLTLMLFTYLAKLPESLDENFFKGFQVVVLTIACGWLFYPGMNMLSLFVGSTTLYHLLLNLVDLLTLGAMSFGFYECMTFKLTSHAAKVDMKGIKKPSMPSAPVAPAKKNPKKAAVVRSLTD